MKSNPLDAILILMSLFVNAWDALEELRVQRVTIDVTK